MTSTIAFTLSVTLALNVATSTITSASGSGNTYYVATNRSDSDSGTFDRPFRTIKQGLSSLRGGDTLFIRGGTYNESMIITPLLSAGGNPSINGTSANNRTWIGGYQNETVTIVNVRGSSVPAALYIGGDLQY